MILPRRLARFFPLVLVVIATAPVPAFAQNEFGTTTAGESALIGILYDFKQNQQRVPTSMDPQNYTAVVNEFLNRGWDERVLNRYYRVTQPLYTTQIFIPNMGAGAAPRAFGVEKIVQPRMWLVHYKGQVVAPAGGRWRFWGYGDDFCAVAVNGRTVMFGGRFNSQWKPAEKTRPRGVPAANGNLIAGDWITVQAGEVINLDIALGERPGGVFSSFILIEHEGDTYARVGDAPVLPIFQLAPYDTPAPASPKAAPVFAKNGPVWKALQ